MKCPQCGAWNQASLPRCFRCGQPLSRNDSVSPDWRNDFAGEDSREKIIYDVDKSEEDVKLKDEGDKLAQEMESLRERKLRGQEMQRDLRGMETRPYSAKVAGRVQQSTTRRRYVVEDMDEIRQPSRRQRRASFAENLPQKEPVQRIDYDDYHAMGSTSSYTPLNHEGKPIHSLYSDDQPVRAIQHRQFRPMRFFRIMLICVVALGLTLGGLASFLTFNRSFNMPISMVTMQFNAIVMGLAGADRIFKLLDQEPEVDEGHVTLVNARLGAGDEIVETEERTNLWAWKYIHRDGRVEYRKLAGDVRFDHVDFGYTDEKMVLHDVSLFAKPGQKIAFVGSTGAGKTTITNLINRFYDIQEGTITYDGIDVKLIRKDDLRRSLGIVLQDTHLFTGTVRENIRYGKLDATNGEVVAAAKLANAHGFITRLPHGYDTMLTGDGANLSQGQRQLLAIARAAIADPPALILDEATSSIDTRTEKLIQEGMDALMYGRTTFVIAHRLSTVRNSDCIMILEQGRIVERGTHEELLEKKGRYYQLYTGNSVSLQETTD